jgi:hypothetical protein
LRTFFAKQNSRLTADKRGIKDFPKLPLATSFIRKTLDEIAVFKLDRRRN